MAEPRQPIEIFNSPHTTLIHIELSFFFYFFDSVDDGDQVEVEIWWH